MNLGDPGSFHLVRYNLAGPRLWHERLALGCGVAGVSCYVLTPDGDRYLEDLVPSADVGAVSAIIGQGAGSMAVNAADMLYRFFALPTHMQFLQHIVDSAAEAGTAVPAGAHRMMLGPGNVLGLPVGPFGPVPAVAAVPPPAAPLGAAAAPVVPAAPVPAAPPPVAAAAVPPVAAAAAPGGLAALVAAFGGAPVAAGAAAPGVAAPVVGALPALADSRVLPVMYNARGERYRPFAEAVTALQQDAMADWPLRGPRTVLWCLKHMATNGGSPTGWHTRWVAEQRLDPTHPNVVVHETCCRTLEQLVCFDQGNAPNLTSAEVVARQLQLAEEKEREVASEGKKDEVSDLSSEGHLYLGGGHTRGNLCIAPELNAWISEELQKESAVLKERRKAREERNARVAPKK